MADLNLKNITFGRRYTNSSYIVSTIVDPEYGFPGVKLIKSPNELKNYYGEFSNKQGFYELLQNGSYLLLGKLNRKGSRAGTLRILNSEFRYCNPFHKYFSKLDDEDNSLQCFLPTGIKIEDVLKYNKYTYSYTIDFNTSQIVDEDRIIIPKYNNIDEEYDNDVIFYFTDLSIPNRKYPNDFVDPIMLNTLGNSSVAFSSTTFPPEDRAQAIYDWYTGNLQNTSGLVEVLGPQGDSNSIPELCELDTNSNKVTLVFKNPIRNIQYSKSLSPTNKFYVYANYDKTNELISKTNVEESVMSFQSNLIGDEDIKISFKHIKNFFFEINIKSSKVEEFYYVSINPDEPLNYGKSIFIDDILNSESSLVKSESNLGTKIFDGTFTESEAINLSGDYLLSYGKNGIIEDEVFDSDSIYGPGSKSPLEKSVTDLIESDVISNIFVFLEDSLYKSNIEYVYNNYLFPNSMLGVINIPNFITDINILDNYILDDTFRDYLIYTYGNNYLNNLIVNDIKNKIIDNSFLFINTFISGKFNEKIDKSKYKIVEIPELYEEVYDSSSSTLTRTELFKFLNNNNINFIRKNSKEYYINGVTTITSQLNMEYMIVANYIKNSSTRFLKNLIGFSNKDIRKKFSVYLSGILNYSKLISNISILDFKKQNEYLNIKLNASLTGLVDESIDITIQINK